MRNPSERYSTKSEKKRSWRSKDEGRLDSYAVLAYINDEAAAGRVKEYLNLGRSGKAELYMNVVNLG
ncbi:hypothetical protein [Thermococcus sp.]|uniref:hypothetical protein n=1 Tax=Thermococcus sp. TaxID=35749 RepID=UPI0025E4588E|nr:hypothetical protein [Thermococcus sp.]